MMFLKCAVAMLLLSCGILSGCSAQPQAQADASSLHTEISSQAEEPPVSFMVAQENEFDYQPGLECAAFSSAYLLRHYGEEAKGLELFETFPGKLSAGGVSPNGIVTFFKERGYTAEYVCDGTVEELKTELAKGAPVIVFIHLQEPYTTPHNTHYIPIVGYDETYFYFAESLDDYANCKDEEGVAYNRKTEIEKFERLWQSIDDVWDAPYFRIAQAQ